MSLSLKITLRNTLRIALGGRTLRLLLQDYPPKKFRKKNLKGLYVYKNKKLPLNPYKNYKKIATNKQNH